MDIVTLAEAEQRLGELLDRALEGEPVRIRRGAKVVELVAASEPAAPSPPEPRPRFDFEALRRLTEGMRPSTVDSVELIRRMRGEERY